MKESAIEFETGVYGVRAIIKAPWQDSFLPLLLDQEIRELELNDGKGWRADDVDFLKSFPDLRSLTIIDLKIRSVDAIHYLYRLENLQLSTYCKTPVDFNVFPELKACGFEWIKGSDSLFESSALETLFLNSYNKTSSEPFAQLTHLKELAILNAPIENIRGLTGLKALEKLRLANLRKLTSVAGIAHLQQMEELEIQRCKHLGVVSEIFALSKLKRLLLLDSGEIASIRGIEQLRDLTAFLFYESTNILDGDLSSLLELQHLNQVSFQNRKHYTHQREDFWKQNS